MKTTPTEFSWTNPNGNQIYAVAWPAAEPVRAVMGIIHGVGEHCRRYDELAEWFGERGVATVGYDRQGCGRSDGRRGYAADYEEYVDEIDRLARECRERRPGLPVFLYGHSLGGQLLLRYLIKRTPDLAGAIVSAPHVDLSFRPSPVLLGLGRLMRRAFPTFAQDSDLDLSQLSRRPEVEAAYRADPLVSRRLTAGTGMDLLDGAAWLNNYAGGLPVPTLLMHGSGDGITSFAATRAFAEQNPEGVTFKEWPGWYHELHNEPEREAVFGYVLEWIGGRG